MMTGQAGIARERLSGQILTGIQLDHFVFQAPATSAQMGKNTTRLHRDAIKRASLSIP